jgi:hypothetical protein
MPHFVAGKVVNGVILQNSGTIAGTNPQSLPSSGAGNVSKPRLTSQGGSAQRCVRVDSVFLQ